MTERLDRPFANGTEGFAWTGAWCDNCLHEHDENHGPDGVVGPGCLHLTHSIAGTTPLIWQPFEQDWWRKLPAGIECRGFERCACEEHPQARLARGGRL